MTLLVLVYIDDETKASIIFQPSNASDELAGVENCRWIFYGSDYAKQLGFQILPQLAYQDIYVQGESLLILRQEAMEIINRVDAFVVTSGLDKSYIVSRVQNILRAVEQAITVSGGVYIG